jgi:hypothetical protein
MNEMKTMKSDKTEIIEQIAELSKLLGMIPSDDRITVNEPVTNQSMALSNWFGETRKSFLKLSILIDRALDLDLR